VTLARAASTTGGGRTLGEGVVYVGAHMRTRTNKISTPTVSSEHRKSEADQWKRGTPRHHQDLLSGLTTQNTHVFSGRPTARHATESLTLDSSSSASYVHKAHTSNQVQQQQQQQEENPRKNQEEEWQPHLIQ
jgi:hypothetical protein